MIRNGFAVGACMLMLAGCSHVASRQAFPRHYTLTAPTAPLAQSPASGPERNATLQVARMAVAPWLQGTDLYYRLDYLHDNRIAAYAQSDWVAPPARLLESMMQNAIAGGSAWRVVTGPGGPTRTDFSLHVRLDDFSQSFASPQQSAGALDATATLVDNRDGSAVAQRHFHIRTPAPTADAEGGVKALNQAALQFIAEVERWLRTAAPHQRSSSSDSSGGG